MPVVPEDREIAHLMRIIAQAQGVWYSGWTGEEALKCGLRGCGGAQPPRRQRPSAVRRPRHCGRGDDKCLPVRVAQHRGFAG